MEFTASIMTGKLDFLHTVPHPYRTERNSKLVVLVVAS